MAVIEGSSTKYAQDGKYAISSSNSGNIFGVIYKCTLKIVHVSVAWHIVDCSQMREKVEEFSCQMSVISPRLAGE